MRYIHNHIKKIIETYEGEIPLNLYLKNYFKKHPILGSRDRKMLSEMAFAWYRCSKAFAASLSFEKKLEACLFLCDTQVHQLLQLLKPEWQGKHDYFLPQKINQLQKEKINFDMDKLFNSNAQFSDGIDKTEWLQSMFRQPDLFIRYRKNPKTLIKLLGENNIHFRQVSDTCFALPNATKLEQFLPDADYVVQDASSQQTGNYFNPNKNEHWWDCCSGAGGKSLLLKDLETKIQLTVTDKRETILNNLKNRFSLYFKQQPEMMVVDVADEKALSRQMEGRSFDNIICDVPCSGSGTWARTPEQLYYFDPKTIKDFSKLQTTIATNAFKYLKAGGRMIYITCSVFKEENEAVIQKIEEAKIEKTQLINGIENKADSMFVAVLTK